MPLIGRLHAGVTLFSSLGAACLCILLWKAHKGLSYISAESNHSALTEGFDEAVNCQKSCANNMLCAEKNVS